ncbi:uncharacterized protein LOC118413010 [Branchiostoma floridae]|uniref:Uncharacterized protein LOC118413010 n=1 Tax=Branchiostoma floridae TaxID=7739 RepID=A0A9J7MMC1_BRAFL|nr:uncharacterized protein LOC118413010 [Branchiostoma floridae]
MERVQKQKKGTRQDDPEPYNDLGRRDNTENISEHASTESEQSCCYSNDHSYAASKEEAQSPVPDSCECVKTCKLCKRAYKDLQHRNQELETEVKELKEELKTVKESAKNSKQVRYDIEQIKDSDTKMSLHTGLTYAIFMWVFNIVASKLPNLQYHKGSSSATPKSYQTTNKQKPGPKRFLTPQNELLMVLMKLRQNFVEDFLAHLFCCSTTLVSQILSTWLPLLALELSPLIYWPTQHELKLYYPDCFKKYKNVRAIIDCTEIEVQRPSLAKANGQIFSNYKNRPTLKVFIACTPAGTVSFVSKSAGGKMSDKEIVSRSNLVEGFDFGDTLLADRGFNIQDLLLDKGVTLVIPPFLKKKNQFAESENRRTKSVANARIHIERVIGRIKHFKVMKGPIPLNMRDLFDNVVIVVCALTNLQPKIVPLKC